MKKLLIVLALLQVLPVGPSWAESSIDIFLGQVETGSDLFTHTDSVGNTFQAADRFEAERVFGIRASVWFESSPNLGLTSDLSYFRPDGRITAVDTLPLSLLFSLRTLPATTSGRNWFLYASAGPALFFYDMQAHLPYDKFSGLGVDLGLDARVGWHWKFGDSFGFFVEYRHTSFDVDGRYESFFGLSSETISMDIDSDHFNVGFSFY